MQNPHFVLNYLRPTQLIYVRETGSYDRSIPRAWQRLASWLNENGLYKPIGRGYGLARDNPASVGAENCRYDACVETVAGLEDRSIRDLGVTTLPGGAYACRRLFGGYDRIHSIVADSYSDFSPLAGLSFDHSRPVVTIYIDNPDRHFAHELRADICVPVTTACEFERPKAAASA